MAAHFPTPRRVGTITVGGTLLNVAALGFPDWAAVVARSITALLVLTLLVMVYTHRNEWLDYLHETKRRGRLMALALTVFLGLGFVAALTWLNWPTKEEASTSPSESQTSPTPTPHLRFRSRPQRLVRLHRKRMDFPAPSHQHPNQHHRPSLLRGRQATRLQPRLSPHLI